MCHLDYEVALKERNYIFMLDVCLLGSGGMMPLPRRWLTALMTRYNGSSLLIDCGEGTQVAIKEKGWSFKPIDVICFTHYHGDHISGLPGLLLTMGNAERTEPLTLIGPKGLERVVNALRVIAPELPFELKFIEINGLRKVVFHSLRHSSATYKLKLSKGDIKATQGDTGHKSAEMITKRYAHILDEDRKVNATKFEDEFYASKENEEKDDASELLDILKNNDALREQLKKMLSL